MSATPTTFATAGVETSPASVVTVVVACVLPVITEATAWAVKLIAPV